MSTRQKINALKRKLNKQQRDNDASRCGKLSENYSIKVKVNLPDECV